MRPYLAVIADSFHAALASRILWAAFIAIWIFLGALAPLGYREDFTTDFRWIDLENGTQMKAMLAAGWLTHSNSRRHLVAWPERCRLICSGNSGKSAKRKCGSKKIFWPAR